MSAQHVAVVSRDAELVGEVRRLAALVGRAVSVAAHAADCPRVCRAAALVVIDAQAADAFDESIATGEVVVVAHDRHRIATWELAVRLGARRVLSLPADAAELLDLLALASERTGPPGPLIGVVGGVGGAGASVLSVALGWALGQSGRRVTVADLDACGGGLDVLVGLEQSPGLRWGDLADARGVIASASLREQLPAVGGLAVISLGGSVQRGDVLSELPDRAALSSVLDAARRGGDAVVVDVPRHGDERVTSVIASCDAVLVVVPAHVRAVSAAASIVRRLQPLCSQLHLVTRADGRGHLRDRDVAAALGLSHVATVASASGIAAAVDRGQLVQSLPRSSLGRTARSIVARTLPGDMAHAS